MSFSFVLNGVESGCLADSDCINDIINVVYKMKKIKYGKKETGGVEHVPAGYDRWGKSFLNE